MTLTNNEVENAKKLALELQTAFTWDETPQGQEYWAEVNKNLNNISRSSLGVLTCKSVFNAYPEIYRGYTVVENDGLLEISAPDVNILPTEKVTYIGSVLASRLAETGYILHAITKIRVSFTKKTE